MSTPSEETVEDGSQRKKSLGSGGRGSSVSGAKTRRYSIGAVTTTPKSIAEGNAIPNYLRASTGSCHDFCKYGHKHEQSKSEIPIKFKRTEVIDTDKVIKTVVPVETKTTTPVVKVKPSADPKTRTPTEPIAVNKNDISVPVKKAQVLKQSALTNGKATRSEAKMVQRSTSFVRPSRATASSSDGSGGSNGGIKKKDFTTVEKTLNTQPPKPLFGRAASSKAIKHKSSKHVSPLKDQNRLLKADIKQTISDRVQTENLHGVEPESEIKPDTVEFDFTHLDIDLTHPDNDFIHSASESFSGKYLVEEEFVEAESMVKPETVEFDSSHIGIDFINSTSESFSGNKFVEEESLAVESEVKPKTQEFDLTHPHIDFIHSTSESFTGKMVVDEEFFEAESKVKHETMEFDFVHPASGSFSGKNVVEEEGIIIHPVNASADVDEELVEESSIAPRVVESSHSCSDKDLLDEMFVLAVFESSESFYDEEVILEDDSEYTDDDDDEEVEVSEEEFKSETADNDKMETSVGSQNKIPRKGRMVMPEDKDDEAVKLRFRRGKILDVKSENNSPRRLKFRKARIMEDKDVKQHVAGRRFKKNYIEERSDSNIAPESMVKPETVEFDSSHIGIDFINSTSESFSGNKFVEEESVAVESEVKPKTQEFDLTHLDIDFIHSTSESFTGKNDVDEEFFEVESKVKHETMEFDFVHPASESFSGKNVVEEEGIIIHPVNASADVDEELVEESSIAPRVVESSHSCSDKDHLEKVFALAIFESSESFYDEEVILEDDSEYTDDDDDEEVEVSEEEFKSETADNDKMETSVGSQNKIPRKGRMVMPEDKDDEAVKLRFRRGKILDVKSENNGPRRLKFRKARIMEDIDVKQHFAGRRFKKNHIEERSDSNIAPESVVLKHQGEQGKKDAQGLFNNVIEETANKLVESRKSKVKALVGAFETVISLQDGKP